MRYAVRNARCTANRPSGASASPPSSRTEENEELRRKVQHAFRLGPAGRPRTRYWWSVFLLGYAELGMSGLDAGRRSAGVLAGVSPLAR
jgi:hypothetical protein